VTSEALYGEENIGHPEKR